MEFQKESEQSVNVILAPEDVESAIRQFICTCHPEYAKGWVIDPQYQLGAVVFHATKD
jgi:hypothetical protein